MISWEWSLLTSVICKNLIKKNLLSNKFSEIHVFKVCSMIVIYKCFPRTISKTWTRFLKNLDPEKRGLWKTSTLNNME